jgi:hypothetical protein
MQSPDQTSPNPDKNDLLLYCDNYVQSAKHLAEWKDQIRRTLLPKLSAEGGYAHLQQHAQQEFSGAVKAHGHWLHVESSGIIERIY